MIATTPHLILTAGNDQHLRIWDVRHFSDIKPLSAEILTPPPSAKIEKGEKGKIETGPMSNVSAERTESYRTGGKGKGLERANFKHGKSCSSAYWDPWGRRILTTSYDDKLRGRFEIIIDGREMY